MTDPCFFCPADATGVVVTISGHLHNACSACMRSLADPLFSPPFVTQHARECNCLGCQLAPTR